MLVTNKNIKKVNFLIIFFTQLQGNLLCDCPHGHVLHSDGLTCVKDLSTGNIVLICLGVIFFLSILPCCLLFHRLRKRILTKKGVRFTNEIENPKTNVFDSTNITISNQL
ncbi:uncharacterized protein LOC105843516 [Hydra vulgaris]|uniref:uncharacterized protein LOC105843516 n=1 Tax=Hydra vulgaris TaxID=6087 RepID=UPI001F5E40ED|nr:uncharacterized protein LOC105843516 [Hydra vulgaris]